MDDIETLEFSRFELLSAYLDDETTAAERKQVELWLATDPEFNRCYQQLLQMQRGFQTLPVPSQAVPVEQTVEQVMARLERKPKLAIATTVGTTAVVATTIAALTGLFSGEGALVPQTAQSPDAPNPTLSVTSPVDPLRPADLLIAIDRSPVEIPTTDSSQSSLETNAVPSP
jgi:anti-sigma factor RsiW